MSKMPRLDSLRVLNIVGNPIGVIEFDMSFLLSLEELSFGSHCTKYVSLQVLKLVACDVVEVCIPPEFQNYLLLPTFDILSRRDALVKFVKQPELMLNSESLQEKKAALLWFLDQSFDLTTLDLSGQADLFESIDQVHSILNNRHLAKIEMLSLDDCNLRHFPDLSSLPNLQSLSIENNFITEIDQGSVRLEDLNIAGNPIQSVSFNLDSFPSLRFIKCGSQETKFISLELLTACVKGLKYIVVQEKYRYNLLLPPAYLLMDIEPLTKYLESPEMALLSIADINERERALYWLIDNYGGACKSFSLANQTALCEKLGRHRLEDILNKLPSVQNLQLSNCGLMTPLDIGNLTQLNVLDISENNIKELPDSFHHRTLTNLRLHGNPIDQVDTKNFEAVDTLVCGSPKAWHISPSTLRKVVSVSDVLNVKVPLSFQKTLVFPRYEILQAGPEAVRAHLDNEELDFSDLKGPDDNLSLYSSIVQNAEKPIKSIRLSNIKFLSKLLQVAEFKDLISSKPLEQSVEYLYIDECDIVEYPKEFTLPNLKHVDISGNPLTGGLDHMPQTVTSLISQHCGLFYCPYARNLELLDIKYNNVTKLKTDNFFTSLKSLDIEGNPIKVVDFEQAQFPKLETLIFSSETTHFISSNVLQLNVAGKLELQAKESDHLYLPPSKYLNNSSMGDYLKGPERYLKNVPNDRKMEALKWLMDELPFDTETFDLEDQRDLCSMLNGSGLEELLSNMKIANIKSLYLDNCGIGEVPSFDQLLRLSTVSLRNNSITDIRNFRHPSVSHIKLQGNPIRRLDFNTSNLPSLKVITCGSPETREITSSVLEQVSKGLFIEIPDEYREFLKIPPYHILDAGKTSVEKYLSKREVDMSVDVLGTIDTDTMTTIIEAKNSNIKVLKISGQVHIFKAINVRALLKIVNLQSLQELYVDNCNLGEIPDVRTLPHLKYLDASNNPVHNWYLSVTLNLPQLNTLILDNCGLDRFTTLQNLPCLERLGFSGNKLTDDYMSCFQAKFDTPHPLKYLDLSGNPIKEMYINIKSFPSLEKLICGSAETNYISFRLLAGVSEGKLSITIPNRYEKHLIMPPSSVLDDSSGSLAKLLNDTTIDLKEIHDVTQRFDALKWLFTQKTDVQYTSLVFSGQNDFCRYIPSFLNNPVLITITHLYLDKCNLDAIPIGKGSVPNLKYLDVSDNLLTEICTNFKYHPRLEKILLDGNPIQTVDMGNIRNNFPRLKYILAGSEYTYYISRSLLKAVGKGELVIDIVSQYRKVLIFPPYEVLEGGHNSVKVYINDITSDVWKSTTKNTPMFLGAPEAGKTSLLQTFKADEPKLAKYKSDVWKSTTNNTLMFLGETGAGKTSLLQTLKADEPKLALWDNRTVILERDVLNLGPFPIATLDFGGHDIYELEYPIFLRGQNIIALILVDLSLYNEENHDDLVTKWLHNCVFSANCKILFVPSKTDLLSPGEVTRKVELMRKLILKTRDDEVIFLRKVNDYISDHKSIKDTERADTLMKLEYIQTERSLHFFETFKIDIVPTSSVHAEGLIELKSKIRHLVEVREVHLPATWDKILQVLEGGKSRFHMTFAEVETHITNLLTQRSPLKHLTDKSDSFVNLNESIEACLHYLSYKGIILWYKEEKEYVYNNMDNVLKLHKELFRHDLERSIVYDEKYQSVIQDETHFYLEKNQFLTSGLLHRNLLQCLWASFHLDEGELEAMIELLKVNNLCFEDGCKEGEKINQGPLLRFPWFIRTTTIQYDWSDAVPPGHLELSYGYTFFRRLPSTLYERISVRLQHILTQSHERKDWADGVFVQIGEVKLLLQRHTANLKDPQITVRLRAPSHDLLQLWKLCLESYHSVVNQLIEKSPVVTYSKVFICPHCILTGRSMESANKLPLLEVMQSRCDDQYDAQCSSSEKGPTLVPAALLQPLVQEGQLSTNWETVAKKHIEKIEQFCLLFGKEAIKQNMEDTVQQSSTFESKGVVHDTDYHDTLATVTTSISAAKPTAQSSGIQDALSTSTNRVSELCNLAKAIVDQRKLKLPKQERSRCPMLMQKGWRTYIGTVSRMEGGTLQGQHSSVQLRIPEGVNGVIIGCVHTEPSRFVQAVPEDECIIAPCTEYYYHPINDEESDRTNTYIINIPHCTSQKSEWNCIKVRYSDKDRENEFFEIPRYAEGKTQVPYFTVDEQFIKIHTSHFTKFICTSCHQSVCSETAMVFVFGNITPSNKSSATFQPFICSFLYNIEDYRMKLINMQRETRQHLIKYRRFSISEENVQESMVEMSLTDSDKKWELIQDENDRWDSEKYELKRRKKLSDVMYYDNKHFCRSPSPIDATTFDLTVDGVKQIFSGKMAIKIREEYSLGITLSSDPLVDPEETLPDSPLTDAVLSRLAVKITPQNMRCIALQQLQVPDEKLDNLEIECHGDVQKFKFKILKYWQYQPKGNRNRYMLAKILYKAAVDSLIDSSAVEEVLGISSTIWYSRTQQDRRSIAQKEDRQQQYLQQIGLPERYNQILHTVAIVIGTVTLNTLLIIIILVNSGLINSRS